VLGKNAHAWTEVYVDGLGWIPFEFTPGFSAGEKVTEEENPDDSGEDNPADTNTEPPVTTAVTTTPSGSNVTSNITTAVTTQSGGTDSSSAKSGDTAKNFDWLRIIPIVLGIGLILGALLIRRQMLRRRRMNSFANEYTNSSILAAYDYILQLLEFSGISRGNVDYLEFAENIEFGNLKPIFRNKNKEFELKFDKSEFKSLTKLASKAKFSDHVLTKADSDSVIAFADDFAKSIYANLKPQYKFEMAYKRGLI
jgi:hypothetical protein